MRRRTVVEIARAGRMGRSGKKAKIVSARWLIILAVVMLMTGCGGPPADKSSAATTRAQTQAPPTAPVLADTAWRFVEIAGTATPAGIEPTLAFAAGGAVTGSTGCNDFDGRYDSAGGDLTFSDLSYTKMACEWEITQTEIAVQTALDRTRRVTTPPGELQLLGSEGTVLARLVPMTPPPAQTPGP